MLVIDMGCAHADPLTVGECISILSGLNSIDHTVTPDGKQISNHYKFDQGTWFAMARDMAVLAPIADAAQKAWNKAAEDFGKPLQQGSPEVLAFGNKYQNEVLDKPCNVRLEHFPIRSLLGPKGENDIPPGTAGSILFLDEVKPAGSPE